MYYTKIALKAVVWSAALTSALIAMSALLLFLILSLFPQLPPSFWLKAACLSAILFLIIKFHDNMLRYPFYKSFKAKRIIDAPIETVWEQIRPRSRNKCYSILTSSIRYVGNGVFRYFQADHSSVSQPKTFHDMKIVNEVPFEFLEMRCINDTEDIVKTSRGHCYALKDLGDGRCEIISCEVHYKPSLFTFYVMEFIGALRDDLRQLACACEGRENISWAAAETAKEILANRPDASWGEMFQPMEEMAIIAIVGISSCLAMIGIWVVLF